MRIAWTIALATAGFSASDPARAGAFTLEPGELKLFATALMNSGDRYFDADGELQPRGRYRKSELQFYGEYGFRDGLTVFGSTGLQRITAWDRERYGREGLGRSEIGLRARLYAGDGWIVSAQGSVLIAGAKKSSDIAVIGETDDQIDIRGLVARSFEIWGKPAFVDLAAGYRARGGDPADEAQLDATIGVRPAPRWLLMAQSFNTSRNSMNYRTNPDAYGSAAVPKPTNG